MARNNYRTDEANVKQQLNFSIIKRLFAYISPYKKHFVLGAIFLLINVLVALIWPKTIQWLIDNVLTPGGAFENNATLLISTSVALLFITTSILYLQLVVLLYTIHKKIEYVILVKARS